MPEFKSNERTFQGVLLTAFNKIIEENPSFNFTQADQEQNVGVGESRFSDTILYSSIDSKLKVFVELKNSSWDATDEELVTDAMTKAFNQGIAYFITGTPRQLVLFRTFEPNTTPLERKLKLYYLANVRSDNDVTTPTYKSQILPVVKQFLKELSDLIHGVTDVRWDTIDKQFINKLSTYILEASAQMSEEMTPRIQSDDTLKKRIREYIKEQDIFHVTINFRNDDIYNLCQLANYLLYLKIIFYSYLQRDVPKLNLKVLSIPEDKHLLNKVLRERFNDVLVHDYEPIFKETALDEFTYPAKYLPELRRNVEQIRHLKFQDLNCDIIGSIYNTLIENQEQHDRGQHFTNTNEVDIVNAFCINKNTKTVLDSGCGAGTFLVRAYAFIKHFDKKVKHIELLERLWGIDIAPFPVFLASMNLSLLDIKELDNYPAIINQDFADIRPHTFRDLIFHNHTKEFTVKEKEGKYNSVRIPQFDVCVGNPPYIRQELIERKEVWSTLANNEHQIKKVNQQSDFYVFYLMHTAAFLKEGGRFGYVISSSWLDVSFGAGLQKFLLDNFKIIAIIDNQKMRSFETASINTVILILEKCSDHDERQKNNVRFVRIYKDYKELISQSDEESSIESALRFASQIEKTNKTVKNENYFITVRAQKQLEEESTTIGKYENGNWGAKYLRSPEIFNKIIDKAGEKLIPLHTIVDVKYCIKSGANDFFYVTDETDKAKNLPDDEYKLQFGIEKKNHKISWEKFGWYYSELTKNHHLMERVYFKPLFKTQKEANNLDVDLKKLKYHVLVCNESLAQLKKYKTQIAKYIERAQKEHDLHNNPTNAQRISNVKGNEREWFNLGKDLSVGDFIFPSKIHEKYGLIDNRKTKVYCDKVNYNINGKKEYSKDADLIFLILNSTFFRFLLELFARQMGEGLTDIDVIVVDNTLVIDPKLLKPFEKELKEIYKSLKGRAQDTIYEEIKKKDRRKLDTIIFEALGLKTKDVDDLYNAACELRISRNEKAGSVTTVKTKNKPDYQTSLKLMQERFTEVRAYYPLIENEETEEYNIPNLPAKFPKTKNTGESNFFDTYNIYFQEGNKQITVSLKNGNQLKLIRFFYEELEVKGTKILLPESPEDCEKIFQILSKDFKTYGTQIKNILKSLRSSASYLAVYRDLIFI
ncbi:MAG: N-6 DNA methylase [Ignavibacteriaceae bacterium]|jgi:tRNA1(Val) A37 N6-methylase TrmN6|nr:N-6 DNA methylase [Ignavibacteriaceae bacterium]